jgi:hypothetical protein
MTNADPGRSSSVSAANAQTVCAFEKVARLIVFGVGADSEDIPILKITRRRHWDYGADKSDVRSKPTLPS